MLISFSTQSTREASFTSVSIILSGSSLSFLRNHTTSTSSRLALGAALSAGEVFAGVVDA